MSSGKTRPNWKARIALLALIPAVVGGLWFFNKASHGSEVPTAAAASSCSTFEADARKLFDNSDTAALRGAFAPGDKVHLVIDFRDVGYSWGLTGVLANKNTKVTGYGSLTRFTETTRSITHITLIGSSTSFTVYGEIKGVVGDATGLARLDMVLDVTKAGDGAITINRTGSAPSSAPPTVVSASCNAAAQPTT